MGKKKKSQTKYITSKACLVRWRCKIKWKTYFHNLEKFTEVQGWIRWLLTFICCLWRQPECPNALLKSLSILSEAKDGALRPFVRLDSPSSLFNISTIRDSEARPETLSWSIVPTGDQTVPWPLRSRPWDGSLQFTKRLKHSQWTSHSFKKEMKREQRMGIVS